MSAQRASVLEPAGARVETNETRTRRVFGLDVLRATAILLVLLAHAMRFSPYSGARAGRAVIVFGYFGVELFFALSGFLIGRILLQLADGPLRISTLTNFWTRRWLRTIPAYYAALLLTPVLYLILYGATNLAIADVWPHFVFVQNLWKPHPDFFGVAWSLSVEEWFYLLFPILLLIAGKAFRPTGGVNVLRVLLLLLAVGVLARLVMGSMSRGWDAGVRKVVMFRPDAIAFGVLVAWLVRSKPGFCARRNVWLLTGAILLAILVFLLVYCGPVDNTMNVFSLHIVFPFTGIAFACLLPWFSSWVPRRSGLIVRSIEFVSVVSYALYLMHSPVWEVYANYSGDQNEGAGQWMIFGSYLLVSLLAASILHYAVERPFLRLRDKRFPASA